MLAVGAGGVFTRREVPPALPPVGNPGTGEGLGGDVGLRGQGARGELVVGLVVAGQREAGGGDVLGGADVLGVKRRRAAGQRDLLAADHTGQVAARDRGVAVAVV